MATTEIQEESSSSINSSKLHGKNSNNDIIIASLFNQDNHIVHRPAFGDDDSFPDDAPKTRMTAKINRDAWTKIVPSYIHNNHRGLDVSITFQNATFGALEMVDRCFAANDIYLSAEQHRVVVHYLEQCFAIFQRVYETGSNSSFMNTKNDEQVRYTYQARIVSSRGAVGGKCPRWHVDHVPVRLLSALVGPGVCYIPHTSSSGDNALLNLDVLNASDDVDTNAANRAIMKARDVDSSNGGIKVKHAATGDVILLLGKSWESKVDDVEDSVTIQLKSCIHKSPIIAPFVGRVLLSVDVVVPAADCDCGGCS
eukprot:CAMPEP_0116043028 /NCGR_PEP_ID=MMETSP0321-20121206/26088_1 /TAXON_ID=163516 /ORGANISM="Leptocylindrus danicus var. danicus, Strain B650" /LENGTH=310 /DNA_ID=CAMNT_0003523711 /DNA_START=178 /DNA_END=1110 /DNA_ORIENTATION=-